MKTTHGTHLVDVSVEPDESTEGNSKVHHVSIQFTESEVITEVVTNDRGVSFTVVGEWEWTELKACLKAHFA